MKGLSESFNELVDADNFIISPVVEDESYPMVILITITGMMIIGGYINETKSFVIIHNPIWMQETVNKGDGNSVGVNIMMNRPIISLGLPDYMHFKPASIYVMSKNAKNDQSLVSSYVNVIKEIKVADSGIAIPNQQDILRMK